MYRIGIDVGGIFTDVTLLNSETGAYYTYKFPPLCMTSQKQLQTGQRDSGALRGPGGAAGVFWPRHHGCNQHDY